MYIKKDDAVFGFGQIGEDKMIANLGEFEFGDNTLIKKLSFEVYEDEDRGISLYVYKDKLLTFKELHKEFLKDYYGVK